MERNDIEVMFITAIIYTNRERKAEGRESGSKGAIKKIHAV